MSRRELPPGWANCTISDVIAHGGIFTDGDWVESKDQDPNGDVRLIQLADVGDGNFIDKSARYLTTEKAYSLNCTFLEKDDLLVARMPYPLGRCCIFPFDSHEKYVTVVDVCVIRLGTSSIDPDFMMYLINSPRTRSDIEERKAGSTRKRISRKNFAGIVLSIAPLEEQRRIVGKIEELFSKLDKGIESLKIAREQLKVYRQAALKHAFEGKLTAQWREENKDKLETADQLLARIRSEREARYEQQLVRWKTAVTDWEAKGKLDKKPSKPRSPKTLAKLLKEELHELPELAQGWLWERLGWMTCGVEYGTAAKSSEIGTTPVLRMGNIQNAKLDWGDLVCTSDEAEIGKYLLKAGDVLFNRTNSPELVGKSAIYRGEQPALFAGYLIRVNHIRTVVHSQYLNLFLNSHIAKHHGNKVKTDGVNQSNINGEKLQNYPFPYCSLAEQNEIVQILDGTLSLADQMEEDINQALKKTESLRQSVLERAFSGKLVEQNPNDESASVLLERIRVEKASRAVSALRQESNQISDHVSG